MKKRNVFMVALLFIMLLLAVACTKKEKFKCCICQKQVESVRYTLSLPLLGISGDVCEDCKNEIESVQNELYSFSD